MMPDSQPDRRLLPRVPVNFPLRIDLVLPEQMRRRVVLEARLHDIHEEGCRVRVLIPLELLDLIRSGGWEAHINFEGREGLPEKLFARHVWVEEMAGVEGTVCYLGFRFENCRQEDKEAIRSFLLVRVLHQDLD